MMQEFPSLNANNTQDKIPYVVIFCNLLIFAEMSKLNLTMMLLNAIL